jgi:hypothetical protein
LEYESGSASIRFFPVDEFRNEKDEITIRLIKTICGMRGGIKSRTDVRISTKSGLRRAEK